MESGRSMKNLLCSVKSIEVKQKVITTFGIVTTFGSIINTILPI